MNNANRKKTNPPNAATATEAAQISSQTFEGLQAYFRDSSTGVELYDRYKSGLIIQEKGHLDATTIEGGLASNMRYMIYTNQQEALKSSFRQYECWTFPRGCFFKVVDVFMHDKVRLVTLLQIQENVVPYFACNKHPRELALVQEARARFMAILGLVPSDNLKDDFWLRRTAFPLGIDSSGAYFFQFDYQGKSHLDPLHVPRGFFKRIFGRK